MSEGGKRKGDARDRTRKRFRSDGTPIWGQRSIDGPGIWATCVKGKEKQTVGELYDLFDALANELWPKADASSEATGGTQEPSNESDDDDDEGDLEDIEKQIAKEVATMKKPRKEQRFANAQTNTPCVVFISCKPPVDPVKLVITHIQNVMKTGISQTRFTQRLTPVATSCPTNTPEIVSLCTRLMTPILEEYGDKTFSYKIELRMRNHNTLKRPALVQELAKCIPEKHKVDLENPDVFILVEIFKSVCGVSVVKDYYKMQKFNVMEIANAKQEEDGFKAGQGRLETKESTQIETPSES
ncbi:hypothetical protein C8Q75DRAFT_724712 [Abortiporus biennis]|nr:hypothetical protein C8Q75DRAFT_724712 [Abortiporus biennis]